MTTNLLKLLGALSPLFPKQSKEGGRKKRPKSKREKHGPGESYHCHSPPLRGSQAQALTAPRRGRVPGYTETSIDMDKNSSGSGEHSPIGLGFCLDSGRLHRLLGAPSALDPRVPCIFVFYKENPGLDRLLEADKIRRRMICWCPIGLRFNNG